MYSNAQLALKFIKYYLTASNGKGHGIHSPFVYEFVTKILNKKIRPKMSQPLRRAESHWKQILP